MKALPYFSPATNLSGAVAAKALWEDTNPTVVGSESGTLAPAQRRQGISLQMHVNNVLRYLVLLSEAQASVLIAGSRLCAELPRFRQELRVLMAEHIFQRLVRVQPDSSGSRPGVRHWPGCSLSAGIPVGE